VEGSEGVCYKTLYYVYSILRRTKWFIWQVQEQSQNASLILADFYLHGLRKIFDENLFFFNLDATLIGFERRKLFVAPINMPSCMSPPCSKQCFLSLPILVSFQITHLGWTP
jgi:hypothetical protein